MLGKLGLYDTEVHLQIGEALISEIAVNWHRNEDNNSCVGSVVEVLRCLRRPEGAIGRVVEERRNYRQNQRLAATGGGDGTEAGGASGAGTSPSSFSVPAGSF